VVPVLEAPGRPGIEPLDALVLDAGSRGGLAVARSLGRGGYEIAVATKGRATRHAREHAVLPGVSADVDRFVAELTAWLQARGADVVLTSTDGGVAALSHARERIERTSAVGLASSAALSVAQSKSKTLARASALGVPVPRSVRVERPDDVLPAVQEVGMPCVIKPDRSWTGRRTRNERVRSVFVGDMKTARRAADRLLLPDATALVQEFAPGSRGAIMLFRSAGRVCARFAMSVSRTWPPLGGNSVMRTSVRLPEDCLHHAERLVNDVGLDGYSEIEFRRDIDGRPLLMEINPRFSQSVELALRSGVDFAGMQVEWARGGRVPEPGGYHVGVRLSWFEAELFLIAASCLRRPRPSPLLPRAIADVVRDYTPPPHLDGLAMDDPLPTASQVRTSLKEFGRETMTGLRGVPRRRGGPSAPGDTG
jgi:predicted ATP-grasp superfamily ATP-dependent carboligase